MEIQTEEQKKTLTEKFMFALKEGRTTKEELAKYFKAKPKK